MHDPQFRRRYVALHRLFENVNTNLEVLSLFQKTAKYNKTGPAMSNLNVWLNKKSEEQQEQQEQQEQ